MFLKFSLKTNITRKQLKDIVLKSTIKSFTVLSFIEMCIYQYRCIRNIDKIHFKIDRLKFSVRGLLPHTVKCKKCFYLAIVPLHFNLKTQRFF